MATLKDFLCHSTIHWWCVHIKIPSDKYFVIHYRQQMYRKMRLIVRAYLYICISISAWFLQRNKSIILASVNFQRHSKDIQEQTFVETFNFFPTPVACLVPFSCFYIPMNTINNENSTLITVSPDIQILPRHSYFARTFNFNSFRMSPRTFKSCPDIHILPRHSTLTHFECLPGHSNFAWTFGFI